MLKRIGGIIGWVGTALVFAAVAIRFLRPEWNDFAHWGAWAGLVCVLVYTLSQWRDIVGAFRRRQTRLGTLTAASIVIVLAILVAINWLGRRQNLRWDLTKSGEFTLSDQTANVLRKLDAPLKITAFEKTQEMARFKDRLPEYGFASKQVSIDYVDPDGKPAVARQYQVQSYGTVVFEYKGRTERVVGDTEQDLTNGIIKVVSGAKRTVYFLQGHGERDPNSTERTGYASIKGALERENYGVERLALDPGGSGPGRRDGARRGRGRPRTCCRRKTTAIRAYLAKGGKLLLMMDPPATNAAADLPLFEGLANAWGVKLGRDVIVDASGLGQLIGSSYDTPVSVILSPASDHRAFRHADGVSAGAVRVDGAGRGRCRRAARSSRPARRSWAEADIDSVAAKDGPKLDEAKGDRRAPSAWARRRRRP